MIPDIRNLYRGMWAFESEMRKFEGTFEVNVAHNQGSRVFLTSVDGSWFFDTHSAVER